MNEKLSSVVNDKVQMNKTEQYHAPTWGLLAFLMVFFLILKSFIYIKDGSRHGK